MKKEIKDGKKFRRPEVNKLKTSTGAGMKWNCKNGFS